MSTLDRTSASSERGIGFQAAGFAVVGCASVAILQTGSESWAYQSFETAATRLYWAFVVPLAALFDWGRKMFETRKAIREAAIERAIQKGVKKGIQKEFQQELQREVQRGVQKEVQKEVQKAVQKEVQKAVQNERRRIVASWEQLRGLSREEIADRISQVGPDSGVSAS